MHFSPAHRIENVPPSFLREIFKLIADPHIISFATGLPNPNLFPVEAFKAAAAKVLSTAPKEALQYGTSPGLLELRTIIAESYTHKDGIEVSPDHIIITNGSQQGLDLLGKVLIDEKDTIAVEIPTYLAAIQAFSVYEPTFVGIPLTEEGMDTDALTKVLQSHKPKLLYTIPNFQNPTGITTLTSTRERIAKVVDSTHTVLIEDDPYGEIRFEGERQKTYATFTEQAVILGSFSKIVAPGLRLGWIVARDPKLYRHLETAKQAADLHTSTFVQHTVCQYYKDANSETHIHEIAAAYKEQRDVFIEALESQFGDTIRYTKPEGGMFIWATFPAHIDTSKLFMIAVEEGVAFVPGESFFTEKPEKNTMRLNFTNTAKENIAEGVARLARAVSRYEAS